MWMRPEYVALLGRRAGVPYEYRWDARALAEAVSRTGTHFIVAAALGKTDAAQLSGDPAGGPGDSRSLTRAGLRAAERGGRRQRVRPAAGSILPGSPPTSGAEAQPRAAPKTKKRRAR